MAKREGEMVEVGEVTLAGECVCSCLMCREARMVA